MVLWLDGFDWLPGNTGDVATTDLQLKYSTALAGSIQVGTGRDAGKSLRMVAIPAGIFRTFDSVDELVIAFAFMHSDALGSGRIMSLNDNTLGRQCRLDLNDSEQLLLYRGNGTELLDTSTTQLVEDVWYYLELRYLVHATAGSYELRINGNTEFSDSGINTRGVASDVLDLFVLADDCNRTVQFDDFNIVDGSGFLGDSYVRDIFPESDGDDSEWTPDSGTDHFARIDETPHDGDTSHLEGALADRDLFNLPAQNIGGQIHGVQLNAIAKRVSGSNLKLKQVVKSDGVFGGGDSDQDVSSTSYDHFFRITEDDPATSATWQPGTFNSAQFGIEGG